MAPHADQIAQILWRDHIQKLAAGWQADSVDFNQQLARHAQTFVDPERLSSR
jgi:hypothetical protein